MRESLTSEDISSQMGMERTLFDGVFLVVEGVTDCRLYGKFASKESVRIVIAHSRDNTERAVRGMARRGDRKVIGITDSDLDILDGRRPSPPLFHTDRRDLEMMMVGTGAFQDVMDEYGDRDRTAAFEERHGPVREAVVSASYPVGLLMHVSRSRNLGLSFKGLDFSMFVNPRTLEVDGAALVSEVLTGSRDVRVGRKQILGALKDAAERLNDPWDAARGHDTVAVLLLGLKGAFGSYNSRGLDADELSGALRLAFSDEDFEGTDLYRDTSAWAEGIGTPLWDLARDRDRRS